MCTPLPRIGQEFIFAAEKMAALIVAGAITTAGSGAMMFQYQLGFFYKMAVYQRNHISLLCVLCLLLYASLALCGPSGRCGSLGGCRRGKRQSVYHSEDNVQVFSSLRDPVNDAGMRRRQAARGKSSSSSSSQAFSKTEYTFFETSYLWEEMFELKKKKEKKKNNNEFSWNASAMVAEREEKVRTLPAGGRRTSW